MNKGQNKLRRLGMNILTSGTFDKYQDDIGIFLRFLLVNTIGIVAAPCLLVFGLYDIATGLQSTGWVITFIGILIVINFTFLRITKNYLVSSWVAAMLLYGSFCYLLSTGGSGNTGPLWIYTLPGTLFILLGVKAGTWITLVFFLYSALVLFFPNSPLLFTRYSPDFTVRFLPTLFTAMALAYIFEYMRVASQKIIVRKNRELTDNVTALEMAGETIRESEEKYRRIFENIQDVYYETTLDGRIMMTSPSVRYISDYDQEELLSMSLYDLYAEPGARDQVIREITEKGFLEDYEILLKNKSGQEIPCAVTARLILDRQGNPEKICGTMRDITQRKRMELEALKSQKLDSIGSLAGGIAHDFNNLLTTIMGNISYSRLDTNLGKETYQALEESEQACVRAKSLTQQLLTFSRGGLPIKKTISIAVLLRDAANFTLSGSRSRCEFSSANDLLPIDVDEGQLNQIINNIVLNADQAMPDGGIVTVIAENTAVETEDGLALPAGNYVKISIKDGGEGIPPSIIQNIFDPYFSTRDTGSGLGLATTYSIVKNHDGLITVDSPPGNGTTFSIYLPASIKIPQKKSEQKDKILSGKGRILLMDDEEIVRKVAGRLIEHIGYEVEETANGREAISSFQRARENGQPFQVIILDLTIPGGMGGRETTEIIRKTDQDIPIIVSSGYSTQAEMARYRTMGFNDVLVKPYRISELSEILRRHTSSNASSNPISP